MPDERSCGFIIYRHPDSKDSEVEFLLLEAAKTKNYWYPPKGHVEKDEDDITTAYRETFEEASLQSTQLLVHSEMKMELRHPTKKGNMKTVIFWLAKLKDPNSEIRLSHEHAQYTWVGFDRAIEMTVYPEITAALKQCMEFIKMHDI